jgi:homoserine dehydrogenase
MNTVNIALFGFGTVGSNLAKMIIQNNKILEEKSNKKINLKYILVRNKKTALEKAKKLHLNISENVFTENQDDIWNDSKINCIIELIGGTKIAKDITMNAIESKNITNFITANKAILAEFGNKIFEKAKQNNVKIGFEASVAGGIPIIQTLQNHFAIGEITKIEGILNGTCNYMLSNLENNSNLSYNEVLKDAQEKGFAEANPSADVDGWDTAAKISILSSICFNTKIEKMAGFSVIGISKITSEKILEAKKQNKKIRLIASAEKIKDKLKNEIKLEVKPQEITGKSMFYSVNGPDNMIIIHHEYLGEITLKGAGAGGEATAMSIISDIINI